MTGTFTPRLVVGAIALMGVVACDSGLVQPIDRGQRGAAQDLPLAREDVAKDGGGHLAAKDGGKDHLAYAKDGGKDHLALGKDGGHPHLAFAKNGGKDHGEHAAAGHQPRFSQLGRAAVR